ncbi:MAG: NCS2 family permease [Alphaproteobacteria bacterium]|jgi:AGZA family xanthine/uracil permease-like MFS transporter|nr:NCS2 family permease [Alphaproteobacteria bacterium]
MSVIDKFFKLQELGTSVATEFRAGVTTFLAMSYIIFVNPLILANTGMDKSALFTATVLIIVFSTLLMGFLANWPVALAPGMGVNAWFAFGIVGFMGYSWQEALGFVFLSGILMIIFTILPVRDKLIKSLSESLKISITAAVGLFIGIIGLKTAGILVPNEATFASFGNLASPNAILTAIGLIIIFVFESRKIRGGVLASIVVLSLASWALGITHFGGVISAPTSIAPIFLELKMLDVLSFSTLLVVVTLFIVTFFDSTATFIGASTSLVKKERKLTKPLLVDGIATTMGSILGVSTTTAYVESIAGIKEGGRTGLTSVFIALLFACTLFFSPLLSIIPSFAASAAMIYVAYLMFLPLKNLEWDDPTELLPCVIILSITTLTFSLFNGIGLGITLWIILKVLYGKWHKSYFPVIIVALLFVLYIMGHN